MTLDEQIEEIANDLATYVANEQWLAATQALDCIERLEKLKKFIGYASTAISKNVETSEPD